MKILHMKVKNRRWDGVKVEEFKSIHIDTEKGIYLLNGKEIVADRCHELELSFEKGTWSLKITQDDYYVSEATTQVKEVRVTKENSYISERIVNISDLERYIKFSYAEIQSIRNELEKDTPSMEYIEEMSKSLHLNLLKAKDFEFCIERRKTVIENNHQS